MRRQRVALALFTAMVTIVSVSPAAAQVRAEARLEKARYVVGEPIFVIVDVTNIGVQPVAYDGSGLLRTPMTVELSVTGVSRRPLLTDAIASCIALVLRSPSGGAWLITHPPVLAPGASRAFRYLLSGYELAAGRYQLTAKGRVNLEWREDYAPIDFSKLPAGAPVPHTKLAGDVVEGDSLDSTFDLVVEAGSDAAIRSAFAPFVADADGTDVSRRSAARQTIMELAPSFLEGSIARWTREAAARGDGTASSGSEALARLNTPTSRAVLRQLATDYEQLQPAAVRLLAALGSTDDVPFFATLLGEPRTATPVRQAAALGLGHVGSDEAVQILDEQLRTASPELARFILTALGISKSPRAVGALVAYARRASDDRLRNPGRTFYAGGGSDLCDALAMLTHRRFCRSGENSRALLQQRLERWASTSAASAPLFGNNACLAEETFPLVE